MSRLRVVIADDQPMMRAGFKAVLEATGSIEVVAEASTGEEAVAAAEAHAPDVVLMDIRMPGLDGLSATESLRARRNAPEVIVLTTFDTDEHVLRALRAGAGGVLLKHTPPRQIADAVRRVAGGEPMMSPEVLRKMIGMVSGADPGREQARTALGRLSPGERDVAEQIALGRTNQEIGTALLMSTATVKAYVSRIFTKLSLTNRVQIALLVHDAR